MTRRSLILKIIKPSPPDGPSELLQINLFAQTWEKFITKYNTGVTDLKAWDALVKRGRGLFCKGPGECLPSA